MSAVDRLSEIRAREEAAHAEVVALCNGARWTMRVPAQPDRDSDLVIEAALDDVRRMADALDAVLALAEPCQYEGRSSRQILARRICAAITDALGEDA